ncbi:DUF2787 family protein [Pectobacterium cacticida]|uniref:DUF2787 family protein n=1 Tax=Pectobacterium cacticida TaxID=69221 RepID=UPI002FF365F2
MKEHMTVYQSGLHLPVSRTFIKIIVEYLPPPPLIPPAVTLNFRDPKYSAESGGFHPVEIRLIHHVDVWYFDYLTDFSYMGGPWPELEKELDISWSQSYVWHYLMGDIDVEDGGALFELWQRNFIHYWKMKIYTVSVHQER